jgi:uncharacterized protein with PIN domain
MDDRTGSATATVRVGAGLEPFVSAQHRCAPAVLTHDGTATFGHLVESLGIPRTEVGVLLADGHPAGLDQQPFDGAHVDVRAVARPQRVPPRFLLDVHLGKLARRLRLLGVDAAWRNDAGDDELVDRAAREDRTLLTQDRWLLHRRALPRGACVRGSRADEQLGDVLDRFAPPLAPWTRCTACNGELAPVSKVDVLDELEPGTRRCYDVYARCTDCGQVYWRGAHSHRIDGVIAAARRAHPDHREAPQR